MVQRRPEASFAISVQGRGSTIVVSVVGVIDFATAPLLRAVLRESINEYERVTVNLNRVSLLDAHSVGMLVAVARVAAGRGGRLRCSGAHGAPLWVLEICGMEKLLDDLPAAEPDEPTEDRTMDVLLRARQLWADADDARDALRRLAILHGRQLATSLARVYQRRGEPADDLTQVAVVGLIKAVDGFDAERGHPFDAYATPTILGELKRHFRDKGWQIRVPRRLQELGLDIRAANEALYQHLHRLPSTSEMAAHLGVPAQDVVDAVVAAQGYRPLSLSTPVGGTDQVGRRLELGDHLVSEDHRYELVDNLESLRVLIAELPDRQRRIIGLRFFDELTQAEIAERVGVSQMHVSRLLSQTLTWLRTALTAESA
jgi:RNA polymerase sigma-B factor